MKKVYKLIMLAVAITASLGFQSCKDDDNDVFPMVSWIIPLKTTYQVPAISGRTETGNLFMTLYSDNTLKYNFTVTNLSPTDQLTMAHFHAGDPLTNGPVVQDFNPAFNGASARGMLMLRQSLADSLMDLSNEIYFNVHSTLLPDGLVRGQVNSDILIASDIALSPANVVPAAVTTAVGTSMIRVTTQKKVFSNVTVTGLEVGDALTSAQIREGAAGVNGDAIVTICSSAADFGVKKITDLTDAMISDMQSNSLYLNVQSTAYQNGLVRGQIK